MQNFFSPEGPMMVFITKLVHSVYLNILWFLCCIPIVTAGASTTALFYVTLKMARNEEGNITQQFFTAFRRNFKSATKVWLILLGIGMIFLFDGYVFYHMRFENAFWTVLTAVFAVAAVAYGIILMYVFPLMARFENSTFAMLKNSIMIGMRFLFCTAVMAGIYFLMILIVVRFFTPAIVFGEGLCALLCSYLLGNILDQLGTKEEEHEEALVKEKK